jgi:hypothetical protein
MGSIKREERTEKMKLSKKWCEKISQIEGHEFVN